MSNQQLDATIDFGVEQAKKRVQEQAETYAVTDLHTVLLAQIRDALWERRTWKRRVTTAIPWAGFGTLVGSLVAALLQALR